MTATPALADVDEVMALLSAGRAHTDAVVGIDRVDLLSHSLQCAEHLRAQAPDDEELQVAGLLHDIGHLLAPDDAEGHGRHGAVAVRALLGDRVADLVELHVPAKRYLVTIDPGYRSMLSPGSVHTLALQGDQLAVSEVAGFEDHPLGTDAVTLRRADEAAKIPGVAVPDLGSWRPVLERVAR